MLSGLYKVFFNSSKTPVTQLPLVAITDTTDTESIERGYLLVTASQNNGHKFVAADTYATAVNQTLEESIEQRIQRANKTIYSIPSNVPQQILRFTIVVPMALNIYFNKLKAKEKYSQLSDNLENLLDSSTLEFPLLNQRAPQTLEIIKYAIIISFYVIENLKQRFFIDQVMPALSVYQPTDKKTLLNILKSTSITSGPILWLWRRVQQDAVLKKIIQTAILNNLFSQQRQLETTMLNYTRINFNKLSADQKKAYHKGMQILTAQVDKDSDNPEFLSTYPSLALLLPFFHREHLSSLILHSYAQTSYSMLKIFFKGSELALYEVPISLLFLSQLYAKAANNIQDMGHGQNKFMVQRYKENLLLNNINLCLPSWARLHQTQEYSIPNPQLETNFFRRNYHRAIDYSEYGNYNYTLLTIVSGLFIQYAIEELAKNTKADSTVTGTVIHVTMLLLFNWMVMTRALTVARNLDNALRHSEDRYQSNKAVRKTVLGLIDTVSEKADQFKGIVVSNSTSIWHKIKPVTQAKPAKIEVIEENKVNNEGKRMIKR